MAEATDYMFGEHSGSTEIFMGWWRALQEDKGEKARLKRASGPTEVFTSPAYCRLLYELRAKDYKVREEALAAVAGLSAHVKELSSNKIARQMAAKKSGGDSAVVSELRFRRLLAAQAHDELYALMVRVIRMLGGEVDLTGLARGVYWWNEKTRKDWAYGYFAS